MADYRKTSHINVRLHPEDRARVARAAGMVRLSPSAFARAAMLAALRDPRRIQAGAIDLPEAEGQD